MWVVGFVYLIVCDRLRCWVRLDWWCCGDWNWRLRLDFCILCVVMGWCWVCVYWRFVLGNGWLRYGWIFLSIYSCFWIRVRLLLLVFVFLVWWVGYWLGWCSCLVDGICCWFLLWIGFVFYVVVVWVVLCGWRSYCFCCSLLIVWCCFIVLDWWWGCLVFGWCNVCCSWECG